MQNTAIYPGAILELQNTLAKLNVEKVFLVTGSSSFDNCGAKAKLNWLFDSYKVIHFNDFKTNPDSKDVESGVLLYKQEKCGVFISIGGGSAIDMAKLINYYQSSNENRIEVTCLKNENFIPVTHISIPTTAGSGAEATHFAVMYIGNNKCSIVHPNLIPDYVIIDPELHYSQTTYQKAASGIDAMAQAIESFWSTQSTEESRLYSEKALALVWNNLPDVVHKSDEIAHLKLAVGANLAGKAINIAKTTAPHALSYGFTKKIGLLHGHAVALTLASFFEFNLKDENAISGMSEVKSKIFKVINCTSVNDGKTKIQYFLSRLNIETKLSNLSSHSIEQLLLLIEDVNNERLSNNPKFVSKLDMYKIINEIF